MATIRPDYLSRDFVSLRGSMLQYAQQTFPEWQPASEGDMGMVLLETFAYMGDIISYYTDRAQFENYLSTATQRDSILNLAFLLGYIPNSATPARGSLSLTTDTGAGEITVPAGTRVSTNRIETLDGPVVFETIDDAVLPANPDGEAAPVVVPVVEGTTETNSYLGASSGLPSQTFLLPHPNVYRDTIQIFIEDEGGSTIINEDSSSAVRVREWTRIDRLIEGESTDKVFETRYTTTATVAMFGDDINGGIPATGLRVYATYRHGVGGSGNVAAGLVRLLNTSGQQGLGVVHVAKSGETFLSEEMTGGSDPESDDSIRVNAPRVYRTQNRVVTEEDFIEVALGTEGVKSANVVVGTFTSVTIYLTGADGAAPTDALKEAVLDRLEGKTLAGVTVSVGDPTDVGITFGTVGSPIEIAVRKGHSLKNVKAAARRVIRTLVAGLAFGAPLSVNRVYNALSDIEGVETVDIAVMARAATPTGVARIVPKPWEIFTVSNIYLDVIRYQKPEED